MRHWLFKTEPESYSIADLAAAPDQTTFWDGVRNYQARNFLRDDLKLGDRVLLYHSNAAPTAIVGVASVVREAYPDHTAWDRSSEHPDLKASADNPIWQMVDIRLDEVFDNPLPLDALRAWPELADMELLRRGSRLSVQPVTPAEFKAIWQLAHPRAGKSAAQGRSAARGRAET